jgi:hypothetical protein
MAGDTAKPPAPADPLASITASVITDVAILEPDGGRSLGAGDMQKAAAAIASLRTAQRSDGGAVNWAGARMMQARTADGLILSLQVVPAGEGALVRVTADAAPAATPVVQARSRAIRKVRGSAYRLDPVAGRSLLGSS